jgi:serine protease
MTRIAALVTKPALRPIVAAAGNGGNALAVGTSANCAGTITVGATNAQRQPSFGPLQGTSMPRPTSPVCWPSCATCTPAQLDSLLAQGALTDDLGATGRDTQYGWGLINARKAVDAAIDRETGMSPQGLSIGARRAAVR